MSANLKLAASLLTWKQIEHLFCLINRRLPMHYALQTYPDRPDAEAIAVECSPTWF